MSIAYTINIINLLFRKKEKKKTNYFFLTNKTIIFDFISNVILYYLIICFFLICLKINFYDFWTLNVNYFLITYLVPFTYLINFGEYKKEIFYFSIILIIFLAFF